MIAYHGLDHNRLLSSCLPGMAVLRFSLHKCLSTSTMPLNSCMVPTQKLPDLAEHLCLTGAAHMHLKDSSGLCYCRDRWQKQHEREQSFVEVSPGNPMVSSQKQQAWAVGCQSVVPWLFPHIDGQGLGPELNLGRYFYLGHLSLISNLETRNRYSANPTPLPLLNRPCSQRRVPGLCFGHELNTPVRDLSPSAFVNRLIL